MDEMALFGTCNKAAAVTPAEESVWRNGQLGSLCNNVTAECC